MMPRLPALDRHIVQGRERRSMHSEEGGPSSTKLQWSNFCSWTNDFLTWPARIMQPSISFFASSAVPCFSGAFAEPHWLGLKPRRPLENQSCSLLSAMARVRAIWGTHPVMGGHGHAPYRTTLCMARRSLCQHVKLSTAQVVSTLI